MTENRPARLVFIGVTSSFGSKQSVRSEVFPVRMDVIPRMCSRPYRDDEDLLVRTDLNKVVVARKDEKKPSFCIPITTDISLACGRAKNTCRPHGREKFFQSAQRCRPFHPCDCEKVLSSNDFFGLSRTHVFRIFFALRYSFSSLSIQDSPSKELIH
jgi:hypothetical protein